MRPIPRLAVVWLVAAVAAGCGDNLDGSDDAPRPTEAPSPIEGVDSPALQAVLIAHWDLEMAIDPIAATSYGDHRLDDRLPDPRPDAVAALRARRRGVLADARAVDDAALTARDRLTRRILIDRLAAEADLDVCDYERWATSSYANPLDPLDHLGDWQPVLSRDDAAHYLARVRAMPAFARAYADDLTAGAAAGETAGATAIQHMISRLDGMIGRPAGSWPLVTAARAAHLASADRDRLVADVTAAIPELVAGYRALRAALAAILPRARAVEGLAGLPGGAACYAAEIHRHTTLTRSADELHATGEAEVARAEAAMLAIAGPRWGSTSLDDIRAHLASAGQRLGSEAEIVAAVRALIDRARTRTAPLFARFPDGDLAIVGYPPEIGAVAASYWPPSPDGEVPARYMLATAPGSQTRWGLEATTFHETIPGHHLQMGRQAAMPDLPALRRVFTDTAFVEGWGLYAERLAWEQDLYSSDEARLVALSNEALRACRLVVDTGLHAQGWTRAQAAAYMKAHTLEGDAFIASEIERYLAWPGQALSYKVGQLELLRLRDAAMARGVSLRDFHEAVLVAGSRPLPLLADELAAAAAAADHPAAAATDRPAADAMARRAR